MNSAVDTNLLLYAHNSSVSQHAAARDFVETRVLAVGEEEFVVCHQTLCELFAALTNSILLPNPLTTEQAWDVCRIYLDHPLIQKIAYEPAILKVIESLLRDHPKRGNRLFDLKLAATLRYHRVRRLYTCNTNNFSGYDFLEVENPLTRISLKR